MATVQQLFDEVRRIIHDTNVSTYRWTDAELIDYLNAATRQIVAFIPEANTVQEVVTISNDIARQVLPAGGIKFIRAARNFADDGTTPQGVIRYVEKDVLDSYDPDWEYDTTIKADGANFFEHYCHDPREPTVYYLYPPQAAANKRVAVVYSKTPTTMAGVGDTFVLNDEYINGAIQYVIYRALTKESRDTLPSAFRQELWNNFLTALGLEQEARNSVSTSDPENRPPGGA